MEKAIQICPKCQRENQRHALVCIYCGVSLSSSTTIIVPEHPAGMSRPEFLSRLLSSHSDALVLLVMGQDQPIIVKDEARISLGRFTPGEPPVTIDLSKYDGVALGVSRRHALIAFSAESKTLEDLGSSNGTFLNEQRLPPHQPHPLKNGDLIRLGQLMLFVFFSAERAATPGVLRPVDEQTIWLHDRENLAEMYPGKPLPPCYMTEKVLPYLSALVEVQHVLNSVRDENQAGQLALGITTIARARTRSEITVGLMGASAAVSMIQSLPSLEVVSDPALRELGRQMLTRYKHDIPPGQLDAFGELLLAPLKLLMTSSLRIVPAQEPAVTSPP